MSCAFLSSANLAICLANCLEVDALVRIERLLLLLFLELGRLIFAQYAPAFMRALEGFGNGEESAGFFFNGILFGFKFTLGFHIVK